MQLYVKRDETGTCAEIVSISPYSVVINKYKHLGKTSDAAVCLPPEYFSQQYRSATDAEARQFTCNRAQHRV